MLIRVCKRMKKKKRSQVKRRIIPHNDVYPHGFAVVSRKAARQGITLEVRSLRGRNTGKKTVKGEDVHEWNDANEPKNYQGDIYRPDSAEIRFTCQHPGRKGKMHKYTLATYWPGSMRLHIGPQRSLLARDLKTAWKLFRRKYPDMTKKRS